MNETRFKVASIHQVLPLAGGGQQCLCGVVLLKHRDATEHITDMVLADLHAQVEALREQTMVLVLERKGGAAAIYAYDNVLDLLDGSNE